MFVKVIFLAALVASLDAQLPNTISSLMPSGSGSNLFPTIDFSGGVPSLPGMEQRPANATACTCAVFMSGQFKRNSAEQPSGFPALISEENQVYPCNAIGLKSCVNRCLESIIKHLPNSDAIICGTINRDCHKERAHLFVQNCEPKWVNSNLSAGREYCCKDNKPYTCPLL